MARVLGCPYVVGRSQRGLDIFCNKLPAPGETVCPKHKLFIEDEALEIERVKERRKLNRESKKAKLDALAASPLRADNPKFDVKPSHGGMEAK